MDPIRIDVRGDLACFTMPEWKAERLSYPLITPSAARNIVQAICWKPAIRWIVKRIKLLKPIQFLTLKTNEIKKPISISKPQPIDIADIGNLRTQRVSTVLKDVAYEVEVEAALSRKGIADGENVNKFYAMLERRLRKGQFYAAPYLGMRDFTAFVSPANGHQPVDVDMDLGYMFYDRFYPEDAKWKDNPDDPKWSQVKSFFFPAKVVSGVMAVPSREEIMGEYA